MTSRSARLVLSEQNRSQLLTDILGELETNGIKKNLSVYAYQSLRVVVEAKEQLIKIMTDNEFRRLHPTLMASERMVA